MKTYPPGDVTKMWKRQFFETKTIGPEPPINTEGFWRKPTHGITAAVKRKKRNDRSNDTGK
jgi:hypothetical protein